MSERDETQSEPVEAPEGETLPAQQPDLGLDETAEHTDEETEEAAEEDAESGEA